MVKIKTSRTEVKIIRMKAGNIEINPQITKTQTKLIKTV